MSATATVQTLTDWLLAFRDVVEENKQWLTELDSAIGDADHGINMARGMSAVADKLAAAPPATPGELGKAVGMTLVTTVGGASGPLYGTFFLRFGVASGAAEELDGVGLGAALRAGLDGVVARGKGEIGDKTMVDAMAPALDAYDAAVAGGSSIGEAASAAAAAAAAGRDSTVPLVARKGRASYLGERSADHMDPGSASTAFLFATLADALR